jgi:uncharacterized membrane protein YfcA
MHFAAMVGIGLAVGMVIGLTGLGAGSLLTPLLILLARMSPATAVGTSLGFSLVTKLWGSWSFHRRGLVDQRIVRELCWGGIPGALAAGLLSRQLSQHAPRLFEPFLLRAIGVVLILVSVVMILRLLPISRLGAKWNPISRLSPFQRRVLITLVAFGVGAQFSLTSIGAGAALVPFMVLLYRLDSGTLVGTNLFLSALLAAVSLAPRRGLHTVDLWAVLALACGSVPALWLSSHLHQRLPRYIPEGVMAMALLGLGLHIVAF